MVSFLVLEIGKIIRCPSYKRLSGYPELLLDSIAVTWGSMRLQIINKKNI